MSLTTQQHKRPRLLDRLGHWRAKLVRAWLIARKNTASKTARRNVPQPVRPKATQIPARTSSNRDSSQGNGMPPSKPSATKPPALPETRPSRLLTVLRTDIQTEHA